MSFRRKGVFVVPAAQVGTCVAEATQIIQLTVEEQRRFIELLTEQPALNAALERAKEAHASLIRSQ